MVSQAIRCHRCRRHIRVVCNGGPVQLSHPDLDPLEVPSLASLPTGVATLSSVCAHARLVEAQHEVANHGLNAR